LVEAYGGLKSSTQVWVLRRGDGWAAVEMFGKRRENLGIFASAKQAFGAADDYIISLK
jgi:hypothetical protein